MTSTPIFWGILFTLFTSVPTRHRLRMPSQLIRKYTQTIPMCYERLRNSVIGSAQTCSRISDELLETSMQRQTACMQPAFGLLQAEFLAMHYTLRDLQCALGTSNWHDNATVTVKCVQEVCQRISNQFRDIIRASQIWDIVTPDHINDRLHALAITLQEQQMTVELLIVVMAFFDYSITAPSVIYQYKIHCHELKRFDNFLHGIMEGVLARRAMRQDILKLRSSSQQFEDRPCEELPDADAWSPSQSTVTMGIMTPTGDWSDTGCNMAVDQDRALEDVLETINTRSSGADIAKLVFHWTNVKEFGQFFRHDLKKEGCF